MFENRLKGNQRINNDLNAHKTNTTGQGTKADKLQTSEVSINNKILLKSNFSEK